MNRHKQSLIGLSVGGTAVVLLCLIALPAVWKSEEMILVMAGATDVQVAHTRFAQEQIVYRLPHNGTPDALYESLRQNGWTRETHDRDMAKSDAPVFFWRSIGAGLISEIVSVSRVAHDPGTVHINLSRCFEIGYWFRCL